MTEYPSTQFQILNWYSTESQVPHAAVKKTDAQWKKQLNDTEFYVCREKGTEHAFSHAYDALFEQGTYVCVCCGHKLFSSATKYDSDCGW